jgi:hypothetical protein
MCAGMLTIMTGRLTELARGRGRLTSLLLAASMGGAAITSPTATTAAEPSADIPGVPLPGAVAAGRLGGAIYDVVYSVNVLPGHVIVASVTGTAGTDFDIYLFDATASTVLSTAGLLIKSNGPTSTESISWPSQFGGTYYIDLNGATDVEGDYRLTVQTIPDPTPPTVSIVLAGGKPVTNQLTVPVALTATDDLSGVTAMAFSADGITFEDWRTFQATSSWTFPAGDGPKPLWVKVRNGVGLESPAVTTSVTIDTRPPEVVALDPLPGSTVVGLRPTFTTTFNEAIEAASWLDLGLIVQSSGGALVPGAYTYNAATRTGSFVPSGNLQPGALYVVTVGDVDDIAGNRVITSGSWSITPLNPTTLTSTASPKVLARGGSARIDVALAGAPLPATITVEGSVGGGAGIPMAPISTDTGRNSLLVTPTANTTYRFRYAGAFGVAPAQADVVVLVRRSVVLVGRDRAVVSRARVGASVNLTAAINPAAAGVSVSFRVYRFDTARRVWVYAGSKGRATDATGRARFTWVPPSPGSWYVRAAVASTVDFANNTSPVYRWSISR